MRMIVCVCVILHKHWDDIFSLERLSPSIHPPNHPFDHSTFYTPFLIHRTHCNTWFTSLILLWTVSPIPPLANPATLFHYLPAILILPTLCSFPLPRFRYPLYDQALRVHFLPKKNFCCTTRRYPLINSISSLTLFSHHLFHLLILQLRTLLCHYSSVITIWTIPFWYWLLSHCYYLFLMVLNTYPFTSPFSSTPFSLTLAFLPFSHTCSFRFPLFHSHSLFLIYSLLLTLTINLTSSAIPPYLFIISRNFLFIVVYFTDLRYFQFIRIFFVYHNIYMINNIWRS